MKTKPGAPNNKESSEIDTKEFDNPVSTLRQRKTELLSTVNPTVAPVRDFDAVISNEQKTQEDITNDLLSLTKY